MRKKQEYFLSQASCSFNELVLLTYKKVFRKTFDVPGFTVIDLGKKISSENLRELMVKLKNELSKKLTADSGLKLNYQWMGRFNQQETTKFHLDSAADQSFLMLGYEPTEIKSKLFFADYIRFANSINISAEEYFEKYNPVFSDAEKFIEPFVTEIQGFDESTFKIVLLNNSNSVKEGGTIGVLHKAEIVHKDLTKERIINSTMIFSANQTEEESFSQEQQLNFITTTKISNY